MRKLRSKKLSFLSNDSAGSMALWSGLMLAVGALITGGIVDYMSVLLQRNDVQRAADKVHLSAPKTGPMAGLLLMEDRELPDDTQHRITSDFADYLVGTIYMPRGIFLIDANQDVAAASEFTVLVVRRLELKAGPRLVLNTDYGLSGVPVPDGVGSRGPKNIRFAH